MKNKSNTRTQQYEFYINDNARNKAQYNFKNNKINTRKYNWVTFIPHALFLQFALPANIYFLISAILQCIPQISLLSPLTALIPIIFVLSVSLIREAIEDCNRAKLDNQQKPTMVFHNKKWENTVSGNLEIGELVHQDLTFPADLILILN